MLSFILICINLCIVPAHGFSQERPLVTLQSDIIVSEDPDHLGRPVYIGEVEPFVLPLDITNTPLKSAKISNIKSANINLKSGLSSTPIWPEPGAINIEKTGEATSTYGKWKINIKVEGKNIPKTTDVILVIDDSGSMSGTKMSSAKSAASNFVDELLTGTTGIRVAAVTINGGSEGNGRPQLDHNFSNDINSLKTAISSITAGGGTNLQGGFYAARLLAESSSADNKVVILLSDGAPTYSYNSQLSTDFNVACGSINYFNISRNDFEANHLWVTSSNYSNVVGTGSSSNYTLYTTTINCNNKNRTFSAGNHGIPTKYEADLIKSTGVDIYTIGFEVPSGGAEENVLNSCQNAGYYAANSSNISNVYSTIRSNIAYAATNAIFSDPMSDYVVLVTSGTTPTYSVLPSTTGDVVVSKGTVTFTPDGYVLNDPDDPSSGNSSQIKWLVKWNIGTVSESGDYMYYFVNLAPNTEVNNLYDANDQTYMDYTDVNNDPDARSQTPENFTIPKVSKGGGSIQINYYLVNSVGQPINSAGVVVPEPQYAHRILQNGSASSFYSFNGNISLELNKTYSVDGLNPLTSTDGLTFDLLTSDVTQNVFLTLQSPNQTVWFAYLCRCDQSVNAGNDISTCEGNSIDLFATFTGTPASVNWTGPNGFTSNSIDPDAFSATSASGGEYIVSVYYTMNCITKDTIKINVLQDTEETIYGSDCNVVVVNNIEYTESGTYIQEFTNIDGCDSTLTIVATILKNTADFITEKNNDVSCFGGRDGKLTVNASGETGNLSYSIDDGVNYQSSNVFSGLVKGTYSIKVKDENNCTKTTNSVTIDQPAEIKWSCPTVAASCFNGNDGSVTITFSGGTAPYTLSINGDPFVPQSSPVTFSNLVAGNYSKVLKDANGCIKSGSYTVNQPFPIIASVLKNNDVTCNNGNDGKLTITASGGTGTFTYSINDGLNYQTSNIFEGLTAGTYSINVKDDNDCVVITEPVNITEPDVLTGTDVQTACNSFTWIDGVTYTASNNIAQFTLTNAAGCDSVVALDLTINLNTAENIEVSGCDVVTLNGVDYTVSGTYTQNLQNIAGCDSTLTIVATVTPCIIEPDMKLEDDNSSTLMNTPVTVSVQTNDTNIPEGSVITTPVNTPIGGTIKINTDGSLTYTPPTDYVGEDKFEYTITTPEGKKDSANVIIIVTAPAELETKAVDDEFEIYDDEIAEGSITINDINTIGKIIINTTPVDAPSNGTVVINPDGTIVYTPNPNFSGVDSFSYQINNSIVPTLSDIAVVTIYVLDTDTVPENPFTAEEIFIPNGFSPNDDGINDYFTITLYDEDSNGVYKEQAFDSKFPNAKVEIFNRWGNLVFEKDGFGNTDRWGSTESWWDGRSNKGMTIGKDKLPSGTYFYILYFNDGNIESKAGSVFLNR